MRLRENKSSGAARIYGCGYAAIDEGQVIIPADRILARNQSEHDYDIYYDKMFKTDIILPGKLRLLKGDLC